MLSFRTFGTVILYDAQISLEVTNLGKTHFLRAFFHQRLWSRATRSFPKLHFHFSTPGRTWETTLSSGNPLQHIQSKPKLTEKHTNSCLPTTHTHTWRGHTGIESCHICAPVFPVEKPFYMNVCVFVSDWQVWSQLTANKTASRTHTQTHTQRDLYWKHSFNTTVWICSGTFLFAWAHVNKITRPWQQDYTHTLPQWM